MTQTRAQKALCDRHVTTIAVDDRAVRKSHKNAFSSKFKLDMHNLSP